MGNNPRVEHASKRAGRIVGQSNIFGFFILTKDTLQFGQGNESTSNGMETFFPPLCSIFSCLVRFRLSLHHMGWSLSSRTNSQPHIVHAPFSPECDGGLPAPVSIILAISRPVSNIQADISRLKKLCYPPFCSDLTPTEDRLSLTWLTCSTNFLRFLQLVSEKAYTHTPLQKANRS